MAGLALAVDILAKDRASGTLRKVGDEAGKTGKKFGGLSAATAGLAGGAVGAGLVSFFKSGVSGASDLGETLSKVRNIFGENAGAIEKWSESSAKSFGLSQQAALAAVGQYGDMFKQLGFTGDAAAKNSQQLVKMSADLGSFHNVDPSDVLDRIGAAMRGEYDSLQALIPNINAARVEQEALAATGKKTAKELTAQEKATATLAIITKDGANAANDFAETSGGLANQQRIMQAQFKDVSAEVGAALIPALTKAAQWLLKIIGFVQRNQKVIVPLVAVLGSLAAVVWTVSKAAKAYTAVQAALNVVMALNPIGLVVIAIAALVAGLVLAYKKSETFRNIVNAAFTGLKTVVMGVIRTVANLVLGWFDLLISGAAKAFGWVPGIGGKLKTAAEEFGKFKDRVNRSLSGIQDKEVTIRLKKVGTGAEELNRISTEKNVGRSSSMPGGGRRPALTANVAVNLDSRTVGTGAARFEQDRRTNGYRAAY